MMGLLLFLSVWGYFSDAGGFFLTFPKGAVMASMGFSGSSRWEDPSAIFLNPAAGAFVDGATFSSTNTTTFGLGELPLRFVLDQVKVTREPYWIFPGSDIKNRYWESGFTYKVSHPVIKRFSIRVTGSRFSLGEIIARTKDGREVARYTPYDRFTALSLSVLVKPGIGVGYTLKNVYSFLIPPEVLKDILGYEYGGDANTYTNDFGLLIDPGYGLAFGISLNNLGGKLNYTKKSADLLPKYIRSGMTFRLQDALSRCFNIDMHDIFGLTFSYDIMRDLVGEHHETWKGYGLEWGLLNLLYVRVGKFTDKNADRIGNTKGYGVHIGAIQVDVADDGDIYLEKHNWWVSLTLRTQKNHSIVERKLDPKVFGGIQAILFPGAGHVYFGNPRGIIYFGLASSAYNLYKRTSNASYLAFASGVYVLSVLDYVFWKFFGKLGY